MTDYKKLYSAVSKIAWGYVFILVHININTMDFLPDFAGYIMILYSLNLLKDECRSIMLLRPLGIVLAVWTTLTWVQNSFGASFIPFTQYISYVIKIIQLYFNFQLLTEMSRLAKKYQPEGVTLDKKIINRRNIYTVCVTFIFLFTVILQRFIMDEEEIVVIIFMATSVITLIIMIFIVSALFSLRKIFKNEPLATEDIPISEYEPIIEDGAEDTDPAE